MKFRRISLTTELMLDRVLRVRCVDLIPSYRDVFGAHRITVSRATKFRREILLHTATHTSQVELCYI